MSASQPMCSRAAFFGAIVFVFMADASTNGRSGRDFQYYNSSNVAARHSIANGLLLTAWHPDGGSTASWQSPDPIAFGAPHVTAVQWSDRLARTRATFPSSGGSFYLASDCFLVVVSGAAVLGNGTDNIVYQPGDFLFVSAGVLMGPFIPSGDNATTIYVVGPPLQALEQKPSRANPTIDSSLPLRAGCRFGGGDACAYSGNHTADLINWSDDHAKFPVHYHPHGALYIGIAGRMCYAGDYSSEVAKVDATEVRWVRPGHFYGPEYTCAGSDGKNVGAVVLALHPNRGGLGVGKGGDDGWVSFDPPPSPYVLQYPLVVGRVYESATDETILEL